MHEIWLICPQFLSPYLALVAIRGWAGVVECVESMNGTQDRYCLHMDYSHGNNKNSSYILYIMLYAFWTLKANKRNGSKSVGKTQPKGNTLNPYVFQ